MSRVDPLRDRYEGSVARPVTPVRSVARPSCGLAGPLLKGCTVSQAILVIDPAGQIRGALERADLGVEIQRIDHLNGATPDVQCVALATYGQPDWRVVARLVPRARTLIIATPPDRDDAFRAICSRAYGYIDAGVEPFILRRAVHAVLAGELAYTRGVLADFVRIQLHSAQALRASQLTARQREVVALIAKGSTDKEIGQALGITTATAEKHVTNVLHKLGVPNRAAAAAMTVSLLPQG
jgi:DNA-binding NarL/FixJ family response regulator